MNYFRNNNNWLAYRVNSTINTKHKELVQSKWERVYKSFFKYAFDKKRWWLIVIFITLFYLIGIVVNFKFFNFINIKLETAKIIVDQRTSNTATIISMTLAVVGFLMSNLAVKESFAYRLLFKNSRLYPIIYFTLSTIGSLMLISLLRDTIKSEYIYTRLVIIGTYLVLVVLILIGFLFSSIVHFTNSKRIQELLHTELISEAKLNLKVSIFRKYSIAQYEGLMAQFDAKEFNFAEAFFSAVLPDTGSTTENMEATEDELDVLFSKHKLLKDINVFKISKFLTTQKGKGKIYYKRLVIGENTPEKDDFIWQHTVENSKKEKKYLRECLILKKEKNNQTVSTDIRKYFDQKLEEYSDENKHKNLESILKSYLEVYELEMKNEI